MANEKSTKSNFSILKIINIAITYGAASYVALYLPYTQDNNLNHLNDIFGILDQNNNNEYY